MKRQSYHGANRSCDGTWSSYEGPNVVTRTRNLTKSGAGAATAAAMEGSEEYQEK